MLQRERERKSYRGLEVVLPVPYPAKLDLLLLFPLVGHDNVTYPDRPVIDHAIANRQRVFVARSLPTIQKHAWIGR